MASASSEEEYVLEFPIVSDISAIHSTALTTADSTAAISVDLKNHKESTLSSRGMYVSLQHVYVYTFYM